MDDDTEVILVCMALDSRTPLMLRDNLIGHCADCRCMIQFRPENIHYRLTRLCTACTVKRATESMQ